jgi:hypothetical protein
VCSEAGLTKARVVDGRVAERRKIIIKQLDWILCMILDQSQTLVSAI